ncbi:DUF423-domain-containing protein [Ramicandelaber brevisporus]|nr:DUF423-domain-containing protein [Ramicandelaber brevisporus]
MVATFAPQTLWRLGAALGASGVLFGAYGAHGLHRRVDQSTAFHNRDSLVKSWETASKFQLIHSVTLLALSVASVSPHFAAVAGRVNPWAGTLMTAGTVMFSGSIYTLVLSSTSTKRSADTAVVAATAVAPVDSNATVTPASTTATSSPFRRVIGPITPLGGLVLATSWIALLF